MRISPKEFLKQRRPEQFSDSMIINESQVDRVMLEYYLDTLSNRSQENEFEIFAKRLCELEICPNLLPHTGPSGGGDSKVDSETYPVSDTICLNWFSGIGRKAANERWGFAFSIKKEWKSKLKSDIKKIHDTNRNYKVAYFVSNQYISDKNRAEIEDELRKTYCMDIRVLDRTWILDTVFGKKHEDVVRETLHINLLDEAKVKKGPLDSRKEDDLVLLDKNIESLISKNQISRSVVNDAIESAILSRELEKPRTEIDGRFDRAIRLAEAYGDEHQKYEIAYQHAWTTYWWHEDILRFIDLYNIVEEKVRDTQNIYSLERLVTLWFIVSSLNHKDKTIIGNEIYVAHRDRLKTKLNEIVKEEGKPSASVYASALLLEIELFENIQSGQQIGKTLVSFKAVIVRSKYLIGFPCNVILQVLTEISDALESSPEYSDLFDTIIRMVEERDGEISTAKLLFERGSKLLSKNNPYKAIQVLGQAITKLYKYESRDNMVRALYLIGKAYEEVGLYWAARGSLLTAASLATSEYWNFGTFNTVQAACYKQLKWLELRLGRLPQALDWHQLDFAIRNLLVKDGYNAEKLFDQVNRYDLALGILFLNMDIKALSHYQILPGTLFKLGLDYSAFALIYALGCETELPQAFLEGLAPEGKEDFFSRWASQYSSDHLPATFISTEGEYVQYASTVLGCKIIVTVENREPCIEVAESFLAAIESFLATAIVKHAATREPSIEITIDVQSGFDNLIKYEIDDNKETTTVFLHCNNFNPHIIKSDDQGKLRDIYSHVITDIVARIVVFRDFKKEIEELMGQERAFERALNFTSSFVTIANVLGYKPKYKLSDWIDENGKKYELIREHPLKTLIVTQEPVQKKTLGSDPLLNAKHTDLQTLSVIREVFWDKAKWRGAGYMIGEKGTMPVFILIYEDIESGKQIFESWRKKYGERDTEEQIRISIMQGINRENTCHYRVGVAANINAFMKGKGILKHFISLSRMQTMTPNSMVNLEYFKQAYQIAGYYLLAPGILGKDNQIQVIYDLGLVKKEIHFKEAWKIGIGDLDCILIYPDDKPVIPEGVENPPVAELLRRKNKSS